jgi:hypothetical protein
MAMGYTEAQWGEASDEEGAFFRQDEEYVARFPENGPMQNHLHPDLARKVYFEHYIRFSTTDSRGIALLHKVCALGDEHAVLNVEAVPEIPFTILCCDPEPHKVFGSGFHLLLADISRIKTAIQRAMLDSLRASIDPRTAVDENRVNLEDAENQELGGIVRVDGDPTTALHEYSVSFQGQNALPVLAYFDEVLASRSGRTKGSQGLDADAMQSTTKSAIAAQLSAAQQRIELIARTLKETGVKDLFMGLQVLTMRHQDFPRQVRLLGKWTIVDPRTWDVALDVRVNAALGSGPPEERFAQLMGIKQTQEQMLATIGPSPMVTYAKHRYTCAKLAEMAGLGDASRFFGEVPEDWAPPPPPEKPDPQMILAQVAQQETQAKVQIAVMENETVKLKLFHEQQTARMKIEADMQVKIIEIEAKFGVQIEEARVQADIESMRVSTDAAIRAYEAQMQERIAAAAPAPAQGA